MINFACYVRLLFKRDDDETKRAIVSALGSNLLVLGGKVIIDLHESYKIIGDKFAGVLQNSEPLEPAEIPANAEDFMLLFDGFVDLCGIGESNSCSQFGKLTFYH